MNPLYPPASRAQWFTADYPGDPIKPEKVVWHTTEGSSWPTYDGGAKAPHFTALPDMANRRLLWRQHFPIDRNSRALKNAPGGVQTNLDGAIQVELVGTSDPSGPGLFWPGAPDWALAELAKFARFMYNEWGIPLVAAPLWLPYPASYGRTRARMSGAGWDAFRGHCGHQHVPENDHGDPGDTDIPRVIDLAKIPEDEVTPADIDAIADKVVSKLLNQTTTTGWQADATYDKDNPRTITWARIWAETRGWAAEARNALLAPKA